MKKLNQSILIIAILAIIYGCSTDKEHETKENPLTVDNIESSRFLINADQDTTLLCPKGTVLRIYKNSFIDQSGNKPTEKIDIEVKEVWLKATRATW